MTAFAVSLQRGAQCTGAPCNSMQRLQAILPFERHGTHAQFLLQQTRNFAGFGMATRRLLTVNYSVTGKHLEAPAAGGNQRQRADVRSKQIQEFARQTEGSRGVVSHHTIFDAEIELLHNASFPQNNSPRSMRCSLGNESDRRFVDVKRCFNLSQSTDNVIVTS